jgi:nitroreductase
MNNKLEHLQQIISNRRNIKPEQMNGNKIEDSVIEQLVQLADWAPTHGRTEPWRFYIYNNASMFCQQHAALYKSANIEENFNESSHQKLLQMGDKASHVIIAAMRRGDLPKIPELEETAATSAAIQNLLLGAEAYGLAAYWGSGGMVYKPEMKTFLGLRDVDIVLGALYLGYTDEPAKEGVRKTALSEKMIWM